MDIGFCIKRIERYLMKNNDGVLVVDVQNTAELNAIINHFKVGDNVFISASDYCKNDEFPRLDLMLDELTKNDKTIFLTGLSSFLKLRGYEELNREILNLLGMAINGHVIIITFQCGNHFNFINPRLSRNICVSDGIGNKQKMLVFINPDLPLFDNTLSVNGINEIAEAVENQSDDTIFVKTHKQKINFKESFYNISELQKAYDFIMLKDTSTAILPEVLGTEIQWNYVLDKFKNVSTWSELIVSEFGNINALDFILHSYNEFDDDKKWLFFIALRLYGTKNNRYLNISVSEAVNFDEFIKQVYRSILEIDPCDENYIEYYSDRKSLLNIFGNPIDEVVDFCRIVKSKEQLAIYYLTDNTRQEKELIFFLLDKYGLEYNIDELNHILKYIYPHLYAYLSPYKFKNELLDNYFQTYKYEKVINKILPGFKEIVAEQAEKREYNYILDRRVSKVEDIDKNDSQLFFVDALGVEYLGFIIAMCKEKRLMTDITICRCELPSITSCNKEFVDSFIKTGGHVSHIKEIDEIKHHGKENYDYQRTKLPIHLIRELEIINELLDKIKVGLSGGVMKKAVIISDHGSSRLAVINETENIWKMASKGEHSGRCCLKTELDMQPDSVTDTDEFWVLANYDRFKGGRKANVEVHGGATLEEITIPIIELTYTDVPVEIRLMPVNSSANFTGIPIIEVSFRKKAAIKIFSTHKFKNISINIDGKSYNADPIDDNFYIVDMPDIKQAKQYNVDVYAGDNLVASEIPVIVRKEVSSEKDLL